MNNRTGNNKGSHGWDRTSWLWVSLCALAIFSTVPVARSIQKYISHTIGRDFFTYIVLFIVISLFAALIYIFMFRLNIRSKYQYVWLAASSGFYIYTTLHLRKYPEEAVHLLEFGLLSYFLFRALSHGIRDWTVYIVIALCVLFIGTLDEFIQWITPGRIWDYRDVGINMLAGVFFVLAVAKGIKPEYVRGPVRKRSVNILAGIITLNLLFLGLCLSNTPDMVNRYTNLYPRLSWLRSEEPMTKLNFGHDDSGSDLSPSRIRSDKSGRVAPGASRTYMRLISLGTLWTLIGAVTVVVWSYGTFWKRRLKDD